MEIEMTEGLSEVELQEKADNWMKTHSPTDPVPQWFLKFAHSKMKEHLRTVNTIATEFENSAQVVKHDNQ